MLTRLAPGQRLVVLGSVMMVVATVGAGDGVGNGGNGGDGGD